MTKSKIQQELTKWVNGLSYKSIKNLEITLSVLIPTSEVVASNPFNLCNLPISSLRFSEKGVSEEAARGLLEAIMWKTDRKEISIEDDQIALTDAGIKLLKYIEQKVFEKLGTEKEREDDAIVEVSVCGGTLVLNKSTGYIKLNAIENTLNPIGKEFKVIFTLATNKDNLATYEELVGGDHSKQKRRTLSFLIRNIKGVLGILPEKKARNKDIIRNRKLYGYELITEHTRAQ